MEPDESQITKSFDDDLDDEELILEEDNIKQNKNDNNDDYEKPDDLIDDDDELLGEKEEEEVFNEDNNKNDDINFNNNQIKEDIDKKDIDNIDNKKDVGEDILINDEESNRPISKSNSIEQQQQYEREVDIDEGDIVMKPLMDLKKEDKLSSLSSSSQSRGSKSLYGSNPQIEKSNRELYQNIIQKRYQLGNNNSSIPKSRSPITEEYTNNETEVGEIGSEDPLYASSKDYLHHYHLQNPTSSSSYIKKREKVKYIESKLVDMKPINSILDNLSEDDIKRKSDRWLCPSYLNNEKYKKNFEVDMNNLSVQLLAQEFLTNESVDLETRAYLLESVFPILCVSLEKLLIEIDRRKIIERNEKPSEFVVEREHNAIPREVPFDSINFLAQYLYRNNPKYSNYADITSTPYLKSIKSVVTTLKAKLFEMNINKKALERADELARKREEERQQKIMEALYIEKKKTYSNLLSSLYKQWVKKLWRKENNSYLIHYEIIDCFNSILVTYQPTKETDDLKEKIEKLIMGVTEDFNKLIEKMIEENKKKEEEVEAAKKINKLEKESENKVNSNDDAKYSEQVNDDTNDNNDDVIDNEVENNNKTDIIVEIDINENLEGEQINENKSGIPNDLNIEIDKDSPDETPECNENGENENTANDNFEYDNINSESNNNRSCTANKSNNNDNETSFALHLQHDTFIEIILNNIIEWKIEDVSQLLSLIIENVKLEELEMNRIYDIICRLPGLLLLGDEWKKFIETNAAKLELLQYFIDNPKKKDDRSTTAGTDESELTEEGHIQDFLARESSVDISEEHHGMHEVKILELRRNIKILNDICTIIISDHNQDLPVPAIINNSNNNNAITTNNNNNNNKNNDNINSSNNNDNNNSSNDNNNNNDNNYNNDSNVGSDINRKILTNNIYDDMDDDIEKEQFPITPRFNKSVDNLISYLKTNPLTTHSDDILEMDTDELVSDFQSFVKDMISIYSPSAALFIFYQLNWLKLMEIEEAKRQEIKRMEEEILQKRIKKLKLIFKNVDKEGAGLVLVKQLNTVFENVPISVGDMEFLKYPLEVQDIFVYLKIPVMARALLTKTISEQEFVDHVLNVCASLIPEHFDIVIQLILDSLGIDPEEEEKKEKEVNGDNQNDDGIELNDREKDQNEVLKMIWTLMKDPDADISQICDLGLTWTMDIIAKYNKSGTFIGDVVVNDSVVDQTINEGDENEVKEGDGEGKGKGKEENTNDNNDNINLIYISVDNTGKESTENIDKQFSTLKNPKSSIMEAFKNNMVKITNCNESLSEEENQMKDTLILNVPFTGKDDNPLGVISLQLKPKPNEVKQEKNKEDNNVKEKTNEENKIEETLTDSTTETKENNSTEPEFSDEDISFIKAVGKVLGYAIEHIVHRERSNAILESCSAYILDLLKNSNVNLYLVEKVPSKNAIEKLGKNKKKKNKEEIVEADDEEEEPFSNEEYTYVMYVSDKPTEEEKKKISKKNGKKKSNDKNSKNKSKFQKSEKDNILKKVTKKDKNRNVLMESVNTKNVVTRSNGSDGTVTTIPILDQMNQCIGMISMNTKLAENDPNFEEEINELKHLAVLIADAMVLADQEAKKNTKPLLYAETISEQLRRKLFFPKLLLLKARDNLSKIDANSIAELKSYRVPPTIIHKVICCILYIFGYTPKQVESWQDAARYINQDLLRRMQQYDSTAKQKSSIFKRIKSIIKKYIKVNDIKKQSSLPAQCMYDWLLVSLTLRSIAIRNRKAHKEENIFAMNEYEEEDEVFDDEADEERTLNYILNHQNGNSRNFKSLFNLSSKKNEDGNVDNEKTIHYSFSYSKINNI